MDKTQKEKIRDDREERFRKDFRAGLFKNLLTGLENPFEIEKWWLNELDLAIKETEERMVREIKEKNAPEIEKVNTYIAGKQGEWCICGAWKQYGVNDNHHCTGYRVTC